MIRRSRTRTVILATASCGALFWGAVDIVGVPPQHLWVQLVWVSVGVGIVVAIAALTGWCLNFLKGRR